jgi:hypothetical protein
MCACVNVCMCCAYAFVCSTAPAGLWKVVWCAHVCYVCVHKYIQCHTYTHTYIQCLTDEPVGARGRSQQGRRRVCMHVCKYVCARIYVLMFTSIYIYIYIYISLPVLSKQRSQLAYRAMACFQGSNVTTQNCSFCDSIPEHDRTKSLVCIYACISI